MGPRSDVIAKHYYWFVTQDSLKRFRRVPYLFIFGINRYLSITVSPTVIIGHLPGICHNVLTEEDTSALQLLADTRVRLKKDDHGSYPFNVFYRSRNLRIDSKHG